MVAAKVWITKDNWVELCWQTGRNYLCGSVLMFKFTSVEWRPKGWYIKRFSYIWGGIVVLTEREVQLPSTQCRQYSFKYMLTVLLVGQNKIEVNQWLPKVPLRVNLCNYETEL